MRAGPVQAGGKRAIGAEIELAKVGRVRDRRLIGRSVARIADGVCRGADRPSGDLHSTGDNGVLAGVALPGGDMAGGGTVG